MEINADNKTDLQRQEKTDLQRLLNLTKHILVK